MRKRLRKKLDKQEVFASTDWWKDDAAEEYIAKMRELRERYSKPVVPSLTFPDHPIYPSFKPFIPEIWNDKFFKEIIRNNSNTKRKG